MRSASLSSDGEVIMHSSVRSSILSKSVMLLRLGADPSYCTSNRKNSPPLCSLCWERSCFQARVESPWLKKAWNILKANKSDQLRRRLFFRGFVTFEGLGRLLMATDRFVLSTCFPPAEPVPNEATRLGWGVSGNTAAVSAYANPAGLL